MIKNLSFTECCNFKKIDPLKVDAQLYVVHVLMDHCTLPSLPRFLGQTKTRMQESPLKIRARTFVRKPD